jgi:hypothetical protein
MRRSRWVALAVTLVVSVGTLAATAVTAGAQSSGGGKPKATDVGITATEIHIAVVADVDNPIVPNLFKSDVDAVKGFAKYMNANGGLAGRKVVVDFYDSKLSANATTNAEIQACENDVAMVGTSAVGLSSVDNMRNCKDSTGATTGLPDIPFVSTALVQQCSDQSFPMAPPQVICSTKDEHPQTFQPNIGRAYYYNQKYGTGKLHGIYIYGSDSKSARDSSFVSGIGQMRLKCCTADKDFDISGFAPQSGYTPVVQEMKSAGSNYGQATTYQAMTLLRKEATLQGLTGVKVWDCTVGCYDKLFLSSAGSDSEDQYVDLLFLPFYSKAEQKANKSLANYVKYTGADKVGSFGAYAWAAGFAFRDAVNNAVKNNGGVNGVTRKTIFEELNKIHAFNADGMFGTIDLGNRTTSQCHVLLQVKNGTFVRLFPSKVGTMDCAKKNVVPVKLDIYGT